MAERVRILPEALVNQIAAGEVIERPASVLKELLENALDAGAHTVKVRLDGAAGRSITVADDGCGMGPDDALLALERHATSKIAGLGDLETVATLGFRGEALPSIAAVSRLTLETRRPDDETGTRVEIAGGSVRSVSPAAREPGTTVTVRNLFFNTPVRRKFLRAPATERGHLVRAFLRLALSHPETRLELEMDGERLHLLVPAATLAKRVGDIFGAGFSASLLPVRAAAGDLAVEGFLVDPGRPAAGSRQYFFVNGRPVEDRLLFAAIREGAGSLPGGSARLNFILRLSLDPRAMDVNIHPTKREVRFSQPSRVVSLVAEAVRRSLGEAAIPTAAHAVFSSPAWAVTDATAATAATVADSGGSAFPLPSDAAAGRLLAEPGRLAYGPTREPPPPAAPPAATGIACLGQVLGGYLLASSADRLILIDQHAAHERVVFERVLDRFQARREESQELLFPAQIEVAAADREQVAAALPLLEGMGCRLEPFGPGIFRVLALPPEIPLDALKSFLGDLLGALEETDNAVVPDAGWWEKPAAVVACHAAVKLGDRLGPEDMAALLRDLMGCRDPHRCPHGRPTMVELDRAGIERLFGRR